jgi:hypothetical protein
MHMAKREKIKRPSTGAVRAHNANAKKNRAQRQQTALKKGSTPSQRKQGPKRTNEGCDIAAALAKLSNIEVSIDSVTAVLALSDATLEAFDDTQRIGILGLDSFLTPGGSWAGSEAPARRASQIGTQNGLTVTSLKRSTGSSGSDHHVSQLSSFAVDMSNGTAPTPAMLRTARQIAAAMGYAWPSNGYIETATTAAGYRAQLIYDSSVVSGHGNHVHFGVRKVR